MSQKVFLRREQIFKNKSSEEFQSVKITRIEKIFQLIAIYVLGGDFLTTFSGQNFIQIKLFFFLVSMKAQLPILLASNFFFQDWVFLEAWLPFYS